MKLIVLLLSACLLVAAVDKPEKKKKDITSYSEAELEKLFDEWEENDEEKLEEDELPAHKQKPKPVDLEAMKAKAKDPEDLLRLSKKGQSLMMFVGVADPARPGKKDIRRFTEDITDVWQSALYNNHVDLQVYVIDDNRAIFMFKDGAQAFEAKQFLLKQGQVSEITLEGKQFPGPGAKYAAKMEL